MPAEAGGRPLLPQTAQMQSFTFAPPTLAPRENQRSESGRLMRRSLTDWRHADYVFVDEHNRHKRLKGAAQQSRGIPRDKTILANRDSHESLRGVP